MRGSILTFKSFFSTMLSMLSTLFFPVELKEQPAKIHKSSFTSWHYSSSRNCGLIHTSA